ncbi:MAG: BrnA antitoxin family protein [Burkholderiales bacterium]
MRAEYDFSKGKRGAVIPQKGKTRISIFIDNSVLDEFRARAEKAGTGYQTMMNEALRSYLSETDQLVTEKVLRQVLRQEMPEYLNRNTQYRKARQEFTARGLASAARARKTGKYVPADKVIGKLARKLVKAKERAA